MIGLSTILTVTSKALILGRRNTITALTTCPNAVDTEGLREARYPSFKSWRRVSTAHHHPSTLACHIVHGQEDGSRTRREDPAVRWSGERQRRAIGRDGRVHENETCAHVESVR